MDNIEIIMISVIFQLFFVSCLFYALLVKQMEKAKSEHKILVDQISQLTEKLMARNYAEYTHGQKVMSQEKQKKLGPNVEDLAAEKDYIDQLNKMMSIQPL